MLQTIHSCCYEHVHQHQIHDRRDECYQDLKNPHVWHCDEAKRSILPSEQRVAMFPHTLQCSVGPTKPLLRERSNFVWSLGPGDRRFFVTNLVTESTNFKRQVLVFSQGISRKAACLSQ